MYILEYVKFKVKNFPPSYQCCTNTRAIFAALFDLLWRWYLEYMKPSMVETRTDLRGVSE